MQALRRVNERTAHPVTLGSRVKTMLEFVSDPGDKNHMPSSRATAAAIVVLPTKKKQRVQLFQLIWLGGTLLMFSKGTQKYRKSWKIKEHQKSNPK